MPDQITVTYDLNKEDVIATNMFMFDNSPTLKRQWLMFKWVLPPFLIFFASIMKTIGSGQRSPLVLSLTAVVWLIVARPYWNWSIRRRLGKVLKEGKNKGMLGSKTFTFSPDLIHFSAEQGDGTLKWSGIEKIASSPTATYLFNGAMSAVYVPHRAFANDAYREEFIALAKKYQAANAA